jgi:hypothetical protein
MSGVVPVITGIIDLIDKNLVSKSNLVSNALTGEILVNVENSFHFVDGQEIVLIDYGYNVESSPHYQKYEYAVIDRVINTHWISLTCPIVDPSGGWYISDHSFIQKTIGHSPLYSDRIYYGDREVIPTEEMAVTVEPMSLSNEWIYIHGGLSEEYRVQIMIYGKDIETEEGMKIINLYGDAIYSLLNKNIHIDLDNYKSPLLTNVAAGSTTVVVDDNTQNRQYFKKSSQLADDLTYEVQDNIGIEIDLFATNVSTPGDGKMYISLSQNDPNQFGVTPLNRSYNIQEFAFLSRHGRYFYDSRIDNIEYAMVQKGSAFIRAARLNWFGKEVTEYKFPQQSLRADYFKEEDGESSTSSGSSSGS